MSGQSESGVDLYWLPLGAGGRSVRLNGRVFEALAARLERSPPGGLVPDLPLRGAALARRGHPGHRRNSREPAAPH